MEHRLRIGTRLIGRGEPLLFIGGPCVIEDYETTLEVASFLQSLTGRLSMPFLFKASYDKANRSSLESFRGPGAAAGLEILKRIKTELGIEVTSDIHGTAEVASAAEVLDVLQIPAFLCRQTDLILSAAGTGKPVNIKKGQFMAPWDMANVVRKAASVGNRKVLLTERGAMFGYNNLVVDFRGIRIMQEMGCPVVFDATHSVQLPGGSGNVSGGQREFAPVLARAAVAAGADAVFLEVHPDPDRALCDGPNSLPLHGLEPLLRQLLDIRKALL